MSDGEHECPTCGDAFADRGHLKSHQTQAHVDDAPWRDEETFREAYVDQGIPLPQLADEWGCSHPTLSWWKEHYGIEVDRPRKPGADPAWYDEDALRTLYVEERLSTIEIGDRLGCSHDTVNRELERHGIPRRGLAEAQIGEAADLLGDEEWLHEEYVENGRSTVQIAKQLGCRAQTVIRYLRRHGLSVRTTGASQRLQSPEELRDEATLRELYEERNLSSRDIADEVGCSKPPVLRWLHRHGIDVRNPAPGQDNWRWKGGHTLYEAIRTLLPIKWSQAALEARRRTDHTCEMCGIRVDPSAVSISVHHIVPVLSGGTNEQWNLMPLCKECHPVADMSTADLFDRVYEDWSDDELPDGRLSSREYMAQLDDGSTNQATLTEFA